MYISTVGSAGEKKGVDVDEWGRTDVPRSWLIDHI
jgi:hypothetical protein